MKIDVGAESPVERLALTLRLVPMPVFHTLVPVVAARALLVGTKLGVFEALGQDPLSAVDVAAKLGTEHEATGKLLSALAGLGYLRAAGNGFVLSAAARRWLVSGSPRSLRDFVLEQELLEWRWLEHLEDYVRTGHGVQAHDGLSDDVWAVYQRGMRSVASLTAAEVARRVPVPAGARQMLDIGGSHGYYSVVLCRRHPGLRSVVLDLPQAIRHAAPLLAAEGMGDRVVHRAGDATTDEFGAAEFDLVLIANAVHHFDGPANRDLARRVAHALRPGGFFVILDFVRPRSPNDAGQVGTLNDLLFALTSASGTWSSEELAEWQRGAGLEPRKPIRMRTMPDAVLQAAVKVKPR
jgi:SAM-dependent methyltransferase